MAIHLVLQMTLALLLLLYIHEASAQGRSLAKPGCQEKCGSLIIRYPFGIGANCSAQQTLQIYCNNSYNPPKAFLKNNSLEVLQISSAGTVQVNNPVLSNCGNTSNDHKLMSSGNFTFSDTQNRFTAMGCETVGAINQKGFSVGGCITFCTSPTSITSDKTCFGFCCQTRIPPSLNFINASVSSTGDSIKYQNICRQAFVADQNWFGNLTNIFSVRTMDQVPAVLDWRLNEPCTVGNDSVCGRNASCDQGFCFCFQGYEGNPYSPYGCQDVDECAENAPKNCEHICNNVEGGYYCSCRDGWVSVGNKCIKGDYIKTTAIILIATCAGLGGLLVMAATWWLYKVLMRRKESKLKEKFFKRNGGLLLHQQVSSYEGNVETTKLFTSKELEKATDYFNVDRILGQGGQGTVYKGMLTDGKIVAVKKSKIEDETKLEHFINEVVILSQINHRNVVKLHGCCLETEVPLLVYEFIPNGTLFEYIHEDNEIFPLTWDVRVRVATEVAGALAYLHSAAFGVVLVELLTGQKPILAPRPDDEGRSLVTHFVLAMEEDRILDILDHQITKEGGKEELIAFSKLAYRCLYLNGRRRPTMKQVAAELESIKMPHGSASTQQHYEDIEYAVTALNEHWDITQTSISSPNNSITVDVEPLITKY
ncbi:putative wall associated kinase-like 2 [Heracleum sosnowskyi]|uniref:Wall associated kinase-like 2 n=1 Tax=Heracleum sosnowskyi TaxID=360622 RepID=A0AAD8JFL2_9APIA|nr:putative wall associated kinase-like 2 [Heracleum sosnowskyi]